MRRRFWLLSLAFLSPMDAAVADEKLYRTECAACHVAYPPSRLDAQAWRGVLGGLDRHFGANAELSAEDVATLSRYLESHAGQGKRYASPSLRMTDTSWFRHEHGEVPSALRRKVNMADCLACHTGATAGSWREREIRLPGGKAWRD